ncbi:MAG: glutathione S-transferase family protein [Pseudomonadota bacterium]
MTDLKLTIGDKNLSSWSLRPWFLMKQADIPFEEETIFLDRPETRRTLAEKSPAGFVPFLTHDDLRIWDSLAIAEYLNDLYPDKILWPEDRRARAIARSVSAEMHSGFSNLRTVWPMMVLRRDLKHTTSGGVARDLDRVFSIWRDCRDRFGDDGPFLFGRFSIADAMYAPVASRITTYGPVDAPAACAEYVETILATPAFAEWTRGAEAQEANRA